MNEKLAAILSVIAATMISAGYSVHKDIVSRYQRTLWRFMIISALELIVILILTLVIIFRKCS